MEIICKCGHPAFDHEDYRQVDKLEQCLDFPCDCELTEREVYQIYITEQQARLDTNRAQVEALMAENEKLREINAHTWCAYCEKRYERTEDALAQIREHISVCEKHPMRKVEAERDAARAVANGAMADRDALKKILLRNVERILDDGPCWCGFGKLYFDYHEERCLAARQAVKDTP